MKYKNFILKAKKYIMVLFIIIILLSFIIHENTLYCEIMQQNTQDISKELKEFVSTTFYNHVRTDKYYLSLNRNFYEDIVLKKDFINIFIKNLNWEALLDGHVKGVLILQDELFKIFLLYVEEEQQKYNRNFLTKVFLSILENSKNYYAEIFTLMQHAENAEIFITTPGFKQHVKDITYYSMQKVIKKGIVFSITIEAATITIVFSVFNIPFIIKRIKIS